MKIKGVISVALAGVMALAGATTVNAKGNWIDKSGKHHTKAELDRLAEERLEKRATSQGADSGSSVGDGSGRVDQTNLFEDDEE